jgi:hypothetical protein
MDASHLRIAKCYIPLHLVDTVSTVAEIENALRALPVQDARTIADWLQDYLDEQWDRQIEQDAKSGKLDKLAEQALSQYRAGKTKPLNEVIDDR